MNKLFLLVFFVLIGFISAVSFVSPTLATGSYTKSNSIPISIIATNSENLSNVTNITYSLFNSNGLVSAVNSTGTSNTFSGLSDGSYSFNVTFFNSTGSNSSETRYVVIDTTLPVVSYNVPTPQNNAVLVSNAFNISLNLVETNLANITYYIFSNGALVNATTTNASLLTYYNFGDANYTFNVTVTDLAGNVQSTPTTNISVLAVPPTLTQQNSSVNDTYLLVSWTTDKISTGTLSYGTNNNSFYAVAGALSSSTFHYVLISSLSCGTTYYYNISNCNIAGVCVINGFYSNSTSACFIKPKQVFVGDEINSSSTNVSSTPVSNSTLNSTTNYSIYTFTLNSNTTIFVNSSDNFTLINYKHILEQNVNASDLIVVELFGLSCADYNAHLISLSMSPYSLSCGSLITTFLADKFMVNGSVFDFNLTVKKRISDSSLNQLVNSTFRVISNSIQTNTTSEATPTPESNSPISINLIFWLSVIVFAIVLIFLLDFKKNENPDNP